MRLIVKWFQRGQFKISTLERGWVSKTIDLVIYIILETEDKPSEEREQYQYWGQGCNAFLLPLHYHDKHGMLATASEQPQRLLMTSESNSEASITYENILSWALNASTA